MDEWTTQPPAASLSNPPLVEADIPLPTPRASLPKFGLLVDAGLPDGAGASFLYRPVHWLRLGVGGMTNAISPGVRGSVSFVPFKGWISPSVTVEGGHYFPGDANKLVQSISGDSSFRTAMLEGFGYNFVNGHLGVELGSQRRFSFFLHAGMSRIWLDIPNVQEALNASTQQSWSAKPVHVQLDSVSAKLGFVLFLG